MTAVAVDGVGDGDGFGEAIAFHREAAGVLASPVVVAVGAPLALDERGAIFMVVLSPNLSILNQVCWPLVGFAVGACGADFSHPPSNPSLTN